MSPVKTFTDLGVTEDVAADPREPRHLTPFPIQALAIPLAMKGHDLIGQARTGTGKTIAFALPLLHLVDAGPGRRQAAGARRGPDPRARQPGRARHRARRRATAAPACW